jgi:hypothetical protein
MFANRAIGQTKSTNIHLLRDLFPVGEVGLKHDWVGGAFACKSEASTVGHDEFSLSRLIEAESGDSGSIFRAPEVVDL